MIANYKEKKNDYFIINLLLKKKNGALINFKRIKFWELSNNRHFFLNRVCSRSPVQFHFGGSGGWGV